MDLSAASERAPLERSVDAAVREHVGVARGDERIEAGWGGRGNATSGAVAVQDRAVVRKHKRPPVTGAPRRRARKLAPRTRTRGDPLRYERPVTVRRRRDENERRVPRADARRRLIQNWVRARAHEEPRGDDASVHESVASTTTSNCRVPPCPREDPDPLRERTRRRRAPRAAVGSAEASAPPNTSTSAVSGDTKRAAPPTSSTPAPRGAVA